MRDIVSSIGNQSEGRKNPRPLPIPIASGRDKLRRGREEKERTPGP